MVLSDWGEISGESSDFWASEILADRSLLWGFGGNSAFRKWETKPEKREKPEKQVRHEKHEMPGVWLVVALSVLLLPLPHRGLDVTFLDVGQGDGICIRADSSVILVDGGSSDEKNLGKNRLVPFIKSSGIRRIDSVIVSHGDSDHISGLVWLFRRKRISASGS